MVTAAISGAVFAVCALASAFALDSRRHVLAAFLICAALVSQAV